MSLLRPGVLPGCLALALFARGLAPAQAGEVWVARYNGPGSAQDSPVAIAVDQLGNTYVTGDSAAPGSAAAMTTVKYDPQGNLLWEAREKGFPEESGFAVSLAMDRAGNAYVTGSFLSFRVRGYL